MSSKSTITPSHFTKLIARETPGEIVRWSGRPDPTRAFREGFGLYWFAIPWTAIALPCFGALASSMLWGRKAARAISGWDVAMGAFGLLFTFAFVLIGVAMLLAPWWVRARARRTVYAITDKRVVSIVDGRSLKVTSIVPDHILKIERTERSDGAGTLKLVIGHRKDSEGDVTEKSEELVAVPRVREAERLVWALREATRAKDT